MSAHAQKPLHSGCPAGRNAGCCIDGLGVDIRDWKEMLKRAQDLQLKLCKRLNQVELGDGRACGLAGHPGLKRGTFIKCHFCQSRHALRRRPISHVA